METKTILICIALSIPVILLIAGLIYKSRVKQYWKDHKIKDMPYGKAALGIAIWGLLLAVLINQPAPAPQKRVPTKGTGAVAVVVIRDTTWDSAPDTLRVHVTVIDKGANAHQKQTVYKDKALQPKEEWSWLSPSTWPIFRGDGGADRNEEARLRAEQEGKTTAPPAGTTTATSESKSEEVTTTTTTKKVYVAEDEEQSAENSSTSSGEEVTGGLIYHLKKNP